MIRLLTATLCLLLSISAFAQQEADQKITPISCIGAESGAIVARATYQCVSARGDIFTLAIGGVEISAILAANISLGYAVGPIQKGIYELTFKAGVYKGVGATIINAGPIRLIGAGLGLGGQINFGVPADSLFGGQLVIE